MPASDYFFWLPRPRPRFVTESGKAVHGVMAEFEDVSTAYHAAESVRDAGYSNWDLHAPFPIHGIEEAMGQRRTKLPFIIGAGALTGVTGALLLQYWTTAFDYPLVVQGKPVNAWEPFVMVTFEIGVLFSAFCALIGMLAINGLPRWHHPLFSKERFLRATDDRFFIVVEATDPKFDPKATRDLLRRIGAATVELVEDE